MTKKLVGAALAGLVIVCPAHGAPPQEVIVAYGDLDLATAAGRDELKVRVEGAAAKLCSPVLGWIPDSEWSIHEHQVLYRACVGRLSERAMAQLKSKRD